MDRIDNIDYNKIRDIQLIQLEMLIEVDRICKKNNISYNIIAGTLLGSIRHKGYIPWDDDADVALLRKEYDRFSQVVKKDLDTTRFIFQDHNNTRGYRWGYGKLRRKGTKALRKGQEHMSYHQGIFIDIFPLDYVPDNLLACKLWTFSCFIIRKFLWSEVGRITEKNTIKKILYTMMSNVRLEILKKYLNKMIDYGRSKKSKYVRILTFPPPKKKIGYLRKWYEERELYEFEKNMFFGIKAYDDYLSYKFGDYMKLPPLEQRKTHPFSYLNLNYKEE